MKVLDDYVFDDITAARMEAVLRYWREADPAAVAIYDVGKLKFDPARIVQRASTYFEGMLRDRVNQAALSVTLAFATGSDLDAIASRYPGGVPRLAVVDDPRPFSEAPEDWESDDRYRRRIWLSPAALSPHGVKEAYEFWALTALPTLKDATAYADEGTPNVYVTIMRDGPNPMPSQADLLDVRAFIYENARKGMTDVVSVLAPEPVDTAFNADVWLFPGPDATLVTDQIEQAVADMITRQSWLGYDYTLNAFNAALFKPGVANAVPTSPTRDLIVGPRQFVRPTGVNIRYRGRTE